MADDGMVLSCRPASFHSAADQMFARLADWGVRYVEIPLPEPTKAAAVLEEMRRYGLRAGTVHQSINLQDPALPRVIDEAARRAEQDFGCRFIFTSAQAKELPLPEAYAALQRAGDAAGHHGVTLVLETHPDLITNATVAVQTMRGVNHPYVRVNWDTANVHFYNENVDGLQEMNTVLPWVGTVHLKDTNGGYRAWHFPALGEGNVDFAAILGRLRETGFRGPCAMEIEGVTGEKMTPEEHVDRVRRSVEHLRGLGYFPPLPPLQ